MTLLNKLQAAEAGDRELDEEVWLACGQTPQISGPVNYGKGVWSGPHVSYSLDAALKLAERVLPGWYWSINLGPQPGAYVECAPERWAYYENASDDGGISVVASTPALAVCAAIVAARDIKDE